VGKSWELRIESAREVSPLIIERSNGEIEGSGVEGFSGVVDVVGKMRKRETKKRSDGRNNLFWGCGFLLIIIFNKGRG
jgi:hypothetical protein